ncbi:RimJ/RimL family protein N-acetyltransferase [Bradyrhizobium sp. i1.8.4]|uniref:GNAT family N-acetyltransferase n=1 Tax=unclassified Bradyrhizobium TaxID=2631580 RepID=UPI003D1CA7C6
MIKGQVIALTEIRNEDSLQLFHWINDPDAVRFNAPFSPVHEAAHESWLTSVITSTAKIVFAIRTLPDLRLIGVVQLIDLHPVHRTAELTIRIGQDVDRGRGAGAEAVALAIDFAFKDRNLQRVWLRVFADNERAIKAYQKAGLTIEGTMRRACFIDGRWTDQLVMAKLRDHA